MLCALCRRYINEDNTEWTFEDGMDKPVARCRNDRECFEYVEVGKMKMVKDHAKRFYRR